MKSPGWRIVGDTVYTDGKNRAGAWPIDAWIKRLRYLSDGCADNEVGKQLATWANELEKLAARRRVEKRS